MSRATHPTTPSTPTPMFDAYSHLPQHSSRLNDSVSVLGPAEPTLSPTSIDTFSFHWFDNINAPFSTAADLDTTPWPSDPASQHQPSTLPSIPSTHSCATGDGFDILWGPPEWSAFDLPTRASAPSQRVPVPFPLNDTTWDENSNPHSSTSRWNDQAATTSATTSREEPRALLTTSAPLRNQPAHNLRGTPVAAPLSVVTNTYDSWPAPSEPEDGWCLRDAGGLYATIEEIERWSELES
ncbi:hypothetical protein C8Q79DRAFT_740097 [Trametes meyenii]|nr:hypothetical protein C8Q79DRAFT_740097 [Trametes meyenii]